MGVSFWRALRMAKAVGASLDSLAATAKPSSGRGAFYSEDDIAKGTRSDEKLAEELGTAGFAITCLTPENVSAAWILYETGAVAHRFKNRACPYLLDLEPAQVPPPLGKLQCARADKQDTLKLLRSIDEVADQRLGERLSRVFEQWWPALEQRLRAIPHAAGPRPPRAERQAEDMLAEILETIREKARFEGLISQLQTEREGALRDLAIAHRERAEMQEALRMTREMLRLRELTPALPTGGLRLSGQGDVHTHQVGETGLVNAAMDGGQQTALEQVPPQRPAMPPGVDGDGRTVPAQPPMPAEPARPQPAPGKPKPRA
jgi:hypothetical protein